MAEASRYLRRYVKQLTTGTVIRLASHYLRRYVKKLTTGTVIPFGTVIRAP